MAKKKAFTKGKPKAGKATKSPFKVADSKSKKKPKEVKSNLKKVINFDDLPTLPGHETKISISIFPVKGKR